MILGLLLVIGLVLMVSGGSARFAPDVGEAHGRDRRAGHGASSRASVLLALGAILWCVGAVLALFFVPMAAHESVSTSSSGSVTVTRDSAPLIQASGSVEAAAVAVGAAVVGAAIWKARPSRSMLLALSFLAMAFCFITGFSIGLFFLPVPALLLAAAATSPTDPSPGHGSPSGSTRG